MALDFPASPDTGQLFESTSTEDNRQWIYDGEKWVVQHGAWRSTQLFFDDPNGRIGINDDTPTYGLDINRDVRITGDLTVNGTTTTVDSTTIAVQTSLTFEGATADAYETTLQVTDPTADRTITFPDATGTAALTSDIPTVAGVYAPLASPALTGVPTAPTAGSGTSTTQLATTAFVAGELGGISADSVVDADSDTKIQVEESADEDIIRFDTAGTERMTIAAAGLVTIAGDLTVSGDLSDGTTTTTQAASDNSTKLATTAYVDTGIGALSSNSITDADSDTKIQVEESADEDIIRFDTGGTERMTIAANGLVTIAGDLTVSGDLSDGTTATTQAANDSTTKVATTAFVMTEVGDYLTTATAASTYAPIASPTLTGTPAGPTAASGTNTTQLATTAFVHAKTSTATQSDTPPGSPLAGEMWYESDTGATFTYYDSAWVEIGHNSDVIVSDYNVDGGTATSTYGGITALDGGTS